MRDQLAEAICGLITDDMVYRHCLQSQAVFSYWWLRCRAVFQTRESVDPLLGF